MTDSNLLREDGTYRYGTEEYEAELVEWEYSKRFTEHEDAEYSYQQEMIAASGGDTPETLRGEAEYYEELELQEELDRAALEFIALVPVWENSAGNDRPSNDIPF
jgi:hypothetical protein|tara:strand:- start:192 stop:506 length:315 start_codon:yes stop_codon:yes gene_type:complete